MSIVASEGLRVARPRAVRPAVSSGRGQRGALSLVLAGGGRRAEALVAAVGAIAFSVAKLTAREARPVVTLKRLRRTIEGLALVFVASILAISDLIAHEVP